MGWSVTPGLHLLPAGTQTKRAVGLERGLLRMGSKHGHSQQQDDFANLVGVGSIESGEPSVPLCTGPVLLRPNTQSPDVVDDLVWGWQTKMSWQTPVILGIEVRSCPLDDNLTTNYGSGPYT